MQSGSNQQCCDSESTVMHMGITGRTCQTCCINDSNIKATDWRFSHAFLGHGAGTGCPKWVNISLSTRFMFQCEM